MEWEKYLNSGRLQKPSKEYEEKRNPFESDFGRVIFSPAIRRMHDKTQVFPLTTDDHIHSRLTHSMEVMAIGYSLGVNVCYEEQFVEKTGKSKEVLLREIPIILKNACLVHDIGNPPFGHFGETVIQNYFKILFKDKNAKIKFKLDDEQRGDFEDFDGNAQGFRILTKLQILDNLKGLNLTYATLGAYLKYPNAGKIIEGTLSKSKRGVFQSEKDYLAIIVEECGLKIPSGNIRHPLSFLMEAADSICYLTMDIEDGFSKNWYDFKDFESVLRSKLGEEDDIELFEELDKLNKSVYNYGEEITKIVKLRIYLIQRLVDLAIKRFIDNLAEICSGEYNEELIKDDKKFKLAKKLSTFCKNSIFPKKEILSLELTGHSVLTGLMDYYINFIFNDEEKYRERAMGMISSTIFLTAKIENGIPESEKDVTKLNDYYKLRMIVDFITGMTDKFALDHYQKLSGQKIS